jgi:glycosyl transferase family 25
MVPVFVISLTRSTQRRSFIQNSLGALGIPFRFFDAIDGIAMSPVENASMAPQRHGGRYGRPLNPGEIGCAASFRAVLQKIESEKSEFVCVTEDEAKFSAESRQFLEEKLLQELPKFDVLRLHNDHKIGTKGFAYAVPLLKGYSIFASVKPGLYCTAQIFTRAGASKILAGMIPLKAPIDNMIYRDSRIAGLRVLEVRPSVVNLHPMESTIGNRYREKQTIRSRLLRKTFFLARNIRSLVNFTRAWGFLSLFHLRYFS